MLLSVGGKPCLAGGALHFPHEAATPLLEAIDKMAKQERGAAKRRAKRAGQTEDVPLEKIKADILPGLAPIFTRTWLLYTLGRLSQPPPRLANFDGHDIMFTEIRYPLLPDAAAEIESRLDAAPLIERDVEGVPEWTWLRDETRPAVAPSQGEKHALSYEFRKRGRPLDVRPDRTQTQRAPAHLQFARTRRNGQDETRRTCSTG